MLPAWTKIKNFSRSAHQEVVDEVNYQGNLVGIGPVEVNDTCGGKTVSVDTLPSLFIEANALIVEPENDDFVYDDPRYRCRLLKITKGDLPEDLPGMEFEDDQSKDPEGGSDPSPGGAGSPPDWGYTVTATHLSEIRDYTTGSGDHTLPENSTVVVKLYGVYDRIPGDAKVDKVRWFFDTGFRSKGEYQYQNLQMVTQNEVGWDFDHIHPQVV